MKQKITIKNNGQVWWTGFRNPIKEDIANGILQYNQVKISEYKNIGKKRRFLTALLKKYRAISRLTAIYKI